MAEARGAKSPVVNHVAEDILRQRGIQYGIEYNVRPETISRPNEGTQVRNPEHQAPLSNVKSYAAAMLAGAKFPGVVVAANGELLDGNTRLAAALKAGKTLTVIRIKDHLGIAETKLLQVALNNTHGERLTKIETRSTVIGVVLSGATIDAASVAVSAGYPKEMVKRWISTGELQLRARDLSIDLPSLNDSQKVAVQKLKSDAVLEALLDLVTDAKLQVSEITALVKELNAAETIEDAEIVLATARSVTFATRIREAGTGLVSSPWSGYVKHLRAIEALDPKDAQSIHRSDLAQTQALLGGLIGTLQATKSLVDTRIADSLDSESAA